MYKKTSPGHPAHADSDQPYLLDVICPYTEHVIPSSPQPHGGGHGLLNERPPDSSVVPPGRPAGRGRGGVRRGNHV